MTNFIDTFIQQEKFGNFSDPHEDEPAPEDPDLHDYDESDSQLAPPSTQPRYRTTGTLSFMAPFSPRTVRTIKSFGKRTCTEMELPEDSLDEFTKLPNLLYMFIHVMASMKKYNNLESAHETKKTLASQEFRNILSERLLTLLLSPQLTAYRKGLAGHVIEFIAKNKSLFKVPNGVFEDPEMRAILSSLVRELFTQHRANIKQRITRSINQETPIHELTRQIAPSSIELTISHMARVAFLHIIFQECATALASMSTSTAAATASTLVNESTTGEEGSSNSGSHDSDIHPSKFWEIVDKRLMYIRKAAAEQNNPNFILRFFNSALQQDLKEYPSPDKLPPAPSRVSGEEWQKMIEKGGHFEVDED